MVLIWRDQAPEAGEERIGGKACGLAALSRIGVSVPPWFVVPTEWFRLHLSHNDLSHLFNESLTHLSGLDLSDPLARTVLSQETRRLYDAVEGAPLVEELLSALADALTRLSAGPFAVRSSMVGEDSTNQSFAGQLDSFLFQSSVEEVGRSIKRCWASAFGERALIYRLRSGLPLGSIQMGVVIQQMVDGQVSGVLFTSNPVNGRRQECLLTAAWGMGEGIVSGLCNTDEIVWSHDGAERSYKVAQKDVQAVRASNGSTGTVASEVPTPDRGRRCLSPEQVGRICSEGLCVAEVLGKPQDIEWTLANGRLYFLQARPITSLQIPENTDGPRVVWDNSNIQESFLGVTTPLTFSFASRAYYMVYKQMMRTVGVPAAVIQAHEPILRNLLGIIHGRIYYNINNWYRGLLLLPSFGRNKADMERMMGLEDPVDFVEDKVLSLSEKLRRLPRLLLIFIRLKRRFAALERDVPCFLRGFDAVYDKIDRNMLRTASFSQLMAVLHTLRRNILENWHTPIVNDFFVMMANGWLRRFLMKGGFDDIDSLQNALMSGEEELESTEPTRQLMRMARDARTNNELVATLCAGSSHEALKKIHMRYRSFGADIDDYVARYGDRCMGELKLETVSLREDAAFIIQVVRNYLARPDLDPDRLVAQEKRIRAEAESRVVAKLGILARWRFRRILAKARSSVRNRESMRLRRTRLFGLFRDTYRAIGDRLTEAGRLEAPRDIFYLTVEEIEDYHEGRAVSTDLASLARARKAEYAAYHEKDLPHHFETRGAVYHGNSYRHESAIAVDRGTSTLCGMGCCSGVVESNVRIIKTPREELSVNGKILVAVRTDPGWAPLFPTTSGLLIERGSTLSHSAVVARELGIPAIVGIPGLTTILEDGERVRMDGAQGLVQRIGRE